MIFDRIQNASRYAGIDARIARALAALPQYASREPGRYEIDGDELFILVQAYETKPRAQAQWETHAAYADVQYVCAGCECMGIADADALAVVVPYDEERDVALYADGGEGAMLRCAAGSFVAFYPGEAHMPSVAPGAPGRVKKLVAKIRMG